MHLKPKRFPAALGNARSIWCFPNWLSRSSNGFQHIKPADVRSVVIVRPFSTTAKSYQWNKPTSPQNKAPLSTLPEIQRAGAVDFSDVELFQPQPQHQGRRMITEHVKVPDSVKISRSVLYEETPKTAFNLAGPREAAWYTGKLPQYGTCPGVEADGRVYSLPHLTFQPDLSGRHTKTEEAARIRTSLQSYFDNTWTLTEVLLGSIQGEDSFMRPPNHGLRHPMIFYYGHPAALYVNKLRVAGLLDKPVNAYFEVIFETGVDEMSWDDLSKNHMAWPSVTEVHAYRKQVYEAVSGLIAGLSDHAVLHINQASPLWALVMSFEHERIHLETSSVLISELPLECVRFPQGFPTYHPSAQVADREESPSAPAEAVKAPVVGVHYPVNQMVSVPETTVTIGKPREFPSFGWDNEYGERTFTVPAFKASQFKVTNGEFLEFMQDGGYARNELWTSAGWEWRAFRNVKMPTYFVRTGPQGSHDYVLRLLFDHSASMPWDWPVAVNLHEAAAFAKWKSLKTGRPYRVMTELEHRAIRDGAEDGSATLQGDYATQLGGHAMMEKVREGCTCMLLVTAWALVVPWRLYKLHAVCVNNVNIVVLVWMD
jgi:5-histidylcysteine sulfoxide synthase